MGSNETQTDRKELIFYTGGSPNGHKVAIALEELELPYRVYGLNLPALEHKEQWFLDINPNGRIPAVIDFLEDGTGVSIFESGSILQFLVDRYDTDHRFSYPRGSKEYYETNNWVRPSPSYKMLH